MKKLTLLIALSLIPIIFFGQTNTTEVRSQDQSHDQSKMNKKDCVMMRNGKMLMMKDGKTISMPSEVKLNDGSTVLPDGTVRFKDGKTKSMKNGDTIDMEGKWDKMEKKP